MGHLAVGCMVTCMGIMGSCTEESRHLGSAFDVGWTNPQHTTKAKLKLHAEVPMLCFSYSRNRNVRTAR